MNPPSAEELVGPPPNSLDEESVLENFLGRSQDEAKQFIWEHPSSSAEDFAYMATDGLCFYLPAALSYLESEVAKDDWAFAYGLMCSLHCQVSIFGMRGEPIQLIKQIAEFYNVQRQKSTSNHRTICSTSI